MSHYKCNHFAIHELVPPEVLTELGEIRCWRLFNEEALKTIDRLQENLIADGVCKYIVINNWHHGGAFKYSGYRPPDCTEGAKYSMHKFAAAFDMKADGKEDLELSDKVRQYIRDHASDYPWIRSMELGITWIHVDGRNEEQFFEFNA